MPFTITHPLDRVPTFRELQALASQHNVQIDGAEQIGTFQHPGGGQPSVTGNYRFAPDGGLHGEFTGQVLGKLAGTFAFVTGQAEITITEKPFLLPESILKSKLGRELEKLCAQFPPVA